MSETVNIANRLREMAVRFPQQDAVIEPIKTNSHGNVEYRKLTFAELDALTDQIAAGFLRQGFQPGMKLVLFVPFSIDFIALTFALFKAGAVIVLIDPGMGKTNIFRCLEEVDPDGFVAVPMVHAARLMYRRKFPRARFNVSSKFWMPGTVATLKTLKRTPADTFQTAATKRDDLAAVIFTSGSTGPPKGVAYEHGMFDAQVEMIQNYYGIQSGEVDLPGFPMFGLFNAAMGVTTVIPDMDPTRPADVDPQKILTAINDQQVTQAFGSPAFWNRVGRYCDQHQIKLPTLNRALSAGGPVPVHVLRRVQNALTKPNAEMSTPYGATESLPVASISGTVVLNRTAAATRIGKGTCVGRRFPGVDVKIISISDKEIQSIEDIEELPTGEIGEIIVRSPSVTREYFQRPEATRMAKIPDGDRFWHRIGDVGYFDDEGLLWFCGRKAHIVEVDGKRHFSVCCEAIFNEHEKIYRSAIVGLGDKPNQKAVLIAEPEVGEFPEDEAAQQRLVEELKELGQANPLTQKITTVLLHPALPVDTRHNVKINREALAIWASDQLSQ